MSDQDPGERLTLEKAKWIEELANRTFDFRVESSEILRKEAHTTLGWFFAMIVGSTGFIVSHATKDALPVTIPLGLAVMWTAAEAWFLIRNGLMAVNYPTPGNLPSNIATDERLTQTEAEMRLAEARGLEDGIERIAKLNAQSADAINRARYAIALVPTFTIFLIGVVYTFCN